MSLRYVYTAQGQFKENDQVTIDYLTANVSNLSEVTPKENKQVEQFTEEKKCRHSADCPSGHLCDRQRNVCYIPQTSSVQSNVPQCTHNWQCNDGRKCVDGKCVRPCTHTVQCFNSGGGSCINGICQHNVPIN